LSEPFRKKICLQQQKLTVRAIFYIYNTVIMRNFYETVAADLLFVSKANMTMMCELLTISHLAPACRRSASEDGLVAVFLCKFANTCGHELMVGPASPLLLHNWLKFISVLYPWW
jgi:hypothetical protein